MHPFPDRESYDKSMPTDENTYWRATYTCRQTLHLPKVTKVYVIAIPRKDAASVDIIANAELSRIFQLHSSQVVAKPLGGFVRVIHPEQPHDLVSERGYPVWIEKWRGHR